MQDDVLIVYDAAMLGHNPTGWDPGRPDWTESVKKLLAELYPDKNLDNYSHPERPQRLSAIVDKLLTEPLPGTRWLPAEPAERAELGRVHTAEYVDFIESLLGQARWLSVDTTAVSPDSVAAAKLAAGAGVVAVDALLAGAAKRAFCAVRPPGHHALAGGAMGFCLYNNVAVAAAHARARDLQRVLILDWDLHHGNGTQDIFYADPDVLFIDTHCAPPFYPGTGKLEETGTNGGSGYTINVPLPAGSGNAALLAALEQIIRPAAAAFRPDIVLVSAGFDAHHLDQTFAMDESGFAALTAGMCDIADRYCDGRLVMCLEGGYNADALALSAYASVSAMADLRPANILVLPDDPGIAAVEAAAHFHAARLHP
ncbi:MAG: histone deacetylase [Woeseiaceae bacterium]|nr:histone deacetylase [Woeseiaceae bacterium]